MAGDSKKGVKSAQIDDHEGRMWDLQRDVDAAATKEEVHAIDLRVQRIEMIIGFAKWFGAVIFAGLSSAGFVTLFNWLTEIRLIQP